MELASFINFVFNVILGVFVLCVAVSVCRDAVNEYFPDFLPSVKSFINNFKKND